MIVTDGGQVLLRAAAVVDAVSGMARAQVTHSGTIDTSATASTTNTTETIAAKKGGRVDVLADKGIVRVSGTVKANSTSGTAGADIYIGRDEATHVLAAVGDASGAQLESQGGFVETSGDYLITAGTRVKAREWLLDPFNIEIVDGTAGGTTTAGATALPNYTTTTPTSTISNTDIVANLTDGTSVTISTAGNGGEVGNITVNADIVTTTGTASLTLRADNDIVVNRKIAAEGDASGLNVILESGKTTLTGRIFLSNTSLINAKAGDVMLQTQGGAITTAAGITITGKNVTLNNTGGVIDASTGAITTLGTGIAGAGTNAIVIDGNITATDNLNMYGRATDFNGITLNPGRILSGGNIQATGETGNTGPLQGSYGFCQKYGPNSNDE